MPDVGHHSMGGHALRSGLPVRANEVTVRHEGGRRTVFANQSGPALIWHAAFPRPDENLLVHGRGMRANEKAALGRTISWVRVTVGVAEP